MNQFTEQQLQGIVSPDKERLIYEIGAKVFQSANTIFQLWPETYKVAFQIGEDRVFCFNSNVGCIATFKLKSWKS